LFFDHLSITQYNEFCQIRDLSFRGSPYSQTDGMTDEGTNTLAACGLEEHFPVVLLCQFFGFWREIGFGVIYLHI
jgi:hypothetical protein